MKDIREALDQAEKILAGHKIPMMADAWVELRNQIGNAIFDAYRAGERVDVPSAER